MQDEGRLAGRATKPSGRHRLHDQAMVPDQGQQRQAAEQRRTLVRVVLGMVLTFGLFGGLLAVLSSDSLLPTNEYCASHDMSAGLAAIIVYGIGLGPLGLLALFAAHHALRYLRKVRVYDRAAALTPRRRPGPAAIVGTVIAPSVDVLPVRLVIEQQHNPHGRQPWEEVDRNLHCESFELRPRTGEPIEVLADAASVTLRGVLTNTVVKDKERRQRVAALAHGDQVLAMGKLAASEWASAEPAADYRSAPTKEQSVRLRPPSDGKLLLYSQREREQCRRSYLAQRKRCLLLVLAMVIIHSTLFVGYHFSKHFGQLQQARISKLERFRSRNDSIGFDIYATTVKPPQRTLHVQVPKATFDKLKKGDPVPVRIVSWSSLFDQLGRHPTASIPIAIFGPVSVLGLFVLALIFRPPKRWYEQLVVNEKNGAAKPERRPTDENSKAAG